MRKDITKKFLGKENRYLDKMLSKDVFTFTYRKKINRGKNQISYDEIEFGNVFSTSELTNLNKNNFLALKNIVEKNGKRIEFNMIYCIGDKSHSEFLLGETEITQELYELVMGYNPSQYQGDEYPNSSQRPVECVTWYDAIMFCNKLSILTNKSPYYDIKIEEYHRNGKNIEKANFEINKNANGFRLPLEKEWDYAAKAGTNNQWSGTNDESRLGEYAWFKANSNEQTHPVATKKPNEWGFYDMSGNVWEWCYDKNNNRLRDGRVLRGGSWCDDHKEIALSNYTNSIGGRLTTLGFRVAASL